MERIRLWNPFFLRFPTCPQWIYGHKRGNIGFWEISTGSGYGSSFWMSSESVVKGWYRNPPSMLRTGHGSMGGLCIFICYLLDNVGLLVWM